MGAVKKRYKVKTKNIVKLETYLKKLEEWQIQK